MKRTGTPVTGRPRHTREEILAAARTWIASQAPGSFTTQTARYALNSILNGEYLSYDNATEILIRKVLDQMAEDGELIKIPKGGTSPDGRENMSRQPRFWTLEAAGAAESEYRTVRAQNEVLRERRARIWDELDRRDLTPLSPRGEPVLFGVYCWERLLGLDGD